MRQCRNAGRKTTGNILSEPAGKGSATGTPVGMCPARRHPSFGGGLTGEFPLLSALSSSPASCKSGQSKTYPRHRLFPVPILSPPIFFRIFAQNVETQYDDRRSAAAHAATHTATQRSLRRLLQRARRADERLRMGCRLRRAQAVGGDHRRSARRLSHTQSV